jgi:hypothetical protein
MIKEGFEVGCLALGLAQASTLAIGALDFTGEERDFGVFGRARLAATKSFANCFVACLCSFASCSSFLLRAFAARCILRCSLASSSSYCSLSFSA